MENGGMTCIRCGQGAGLAAQETQPKQARTPAKENIKNILVEKGGTES